MRIYVASSWRNDFQPKVVEQLRAAGHVVYDFKNPPNRAGFGWEQVDTGWRENQTDVSRYLAMLEHPIATAGFSSDMDALRDCHVCVYVGPAGASAGMEFGWACGAGRLSIAFLPAIREPELMFKMADLITDDFTEVMGTIHVYEMIGKGARVVRG